MKNIKKPGGIILLGGKSKRMGTDKYLLPFFNLTLVERLIAELEKTVQEVILITNEPQKLNFLPHKKYPDHYAIPCALTGLHAGLKNSNYELNFVLACDLPLFDSRMIPYFVEQINESVSIAVPKTAKGFEPLCGLYSRNNLVEIEKMFVEENYAIHDLFDRIPAKVIMAEKIEAITHPYVFFNMNTPAEYEEAQKLYAALNKKS
ncbi:molybdenum cofactor guanylyltransferase [bacterium]|nr:molybdenum cofactor guanylyltransferase [bacterium]